METASFSPTRFTPPYCDTNNVIKAGVIVTTIGVISTIAFAILFSPLIGITLILQTINITCLATGLGILFVGFCVNCRQSNVGVTTNLNSTNSVQTKNDDKVQIPKDHRREQLQEKLRELQSKQAHLAEIEQETHQENQRQEVRTRQNLAASTESIFEERDRKIAQIRQAEENRRRQHEEYDATTARSLTEIRECAKTYEENGQLDLKLEASLIKHQKEKRQRDEEQDAILEQMITEHRESSEETMRCIKARDLAASKTFEEKSSQAILEFKKRSKERSENQDQKINQILATYSVQ